MNVRDKFLEGTGRLTPKKVVHIHEEYEKHDWERKENGEINLFAATSGFCNGPFCVRCYATPCEHCNPNYDSEPCIIDRDTCPSCGKTVFRFIGEKFCGECGQALLWDEEGEQENHGEED